MFFTVQHQMVWLDLDSLLRLFYFLDIAGCIGPSDLLGSTSSARIFKLTTFEFLVYL